MSVDQVVTGQIHRGMMHRVNEVGLHHGIVGMLHRIGCVDYIHLERMKTRNTHVYCHKTLQIDPHFRCSSSIVRRHKNVSVKLGHCLHSSVVNASPLCDVTDERSYLDLEVIADVATVEFGADQFEFPVKESLGVPVLVTDKMQDLLVVGHGVHTWNTQRGVCVREKFDQQSSESVRKTL